MTGPVRRAGSGIDAAGAHVTWTVSEGRRGRRWRETRERDGAVLGSLLLETDPAGRFSHAELATAAGLLTLHPEGDGTLHGNVVTDAGVHHVRGLAWDDRAVLLVEGSPVAGAAAVHAVTREARNPDGGIGSVPAVRVRQDLTLEPAAVEVAHVAGATWRIGGSLELDIDDDGLPVLGTASSWALEVDG